jgi:hypothetical protein
METSTSARVRKHRLVLRAEGLRPLQIWVPDTRKRGFAAQCRRQSLLLKSDSAESELMDWMQQAADTEGWK